MPAEQRISCSKIEQAWRRVYSTLLSVEQAENPPRKRKAAHEGRTRTSRSMPLDTPTVLVSSAVSHGCKNACLSCLKAGAQRVRQICAYLDPSISVDRLLGLLFTRSQTWTGRLSKQILAHSSGPNCQKVSRHRTRSGRAQGLQPTRFPSSPWHPIQPDTPPSQAAPTADPTPIASSVLTPGLPLLLILPTGPFTPRLLLRLRFSALCYPRLAWLQLLLQLSNPFVVAVTYFLSGPYVLEGPCHLQQVCAAEV